MTRMPWTTNVSHGHPKAEGTPKNIIPQKLFVTKPHLSFSPFLIIYMFLDSRNSLGGGGGGREDQSHGVAIISEKLFSWALTYMKII